MRCVDGYARRMITDIAVFAVAFFFAVITPGPGVMTLAGVGAGYGLRDGLRYMAGLFIGTNLVALAVVTGVAAIVFATPYLREVLLVASAGFILYLAAKIAFAGAKVGFITQTSAPGFVGGLLLQAINPKAYVVNSAFFLGFRFMPDAPITEILLKFLIINVLWTMIHLAWLAMGVSLHRLDLSPRTQSTINILMALALVFVVALAGYAELVDAAPPRNDPEPSGPADG